MSEVLAELVARLPILGRMRGWLILGSAVCIAGIALGVAVSGSGVTQAAIADLRGTAANSSRTQPSPSHTEIAPAQVNSIANRQVPAAAGSSEAGALRSQPGPGAQQGGRPVIAGPSIFEQQLRAQYGPSPAPITLGPSSSQRPIVPKKP